MQGDSSSYWHKDQMVDSKGGQMQDQTPLQMILHLNPTVALGILSLSF